VGCLRKLKNNYQTLLCILCSSLCFSTVLLCQYFSVEPISRSEGLSNDTQWGYRVLEEDRFGYIWIATLNGLNRYDGYEIKKYLSSASNDRLATPFQGISALTKDPYGNIWAGSQHNGIFKYNSIYDRMESPTFYLNEDTLQFSQINSLYCDNEYLYVGAPWQGAFKIDLRTHFAEELEIDIVGDAHVYDFLRSKKGELIILCTDGVFVEKNRELEFFQVPRNYDLYSFIELKNNTVLLTSRLLNKSLIMNLDNGDTQEYTNPGDHYSSHHFLDSKDNLWLSSKEGVLQSNLLSDKNTTNSSEQITNIDESSLYWLQDMIESKNGDLYFMTVNIGAGKIKSINKAFRFAHQGDFNDFNILDGQIHFWDADKLYKIEENAAKEFPFKIRPNSSIIQVFKDVENDYFFNIHMIGKHPYSAKYTTGPAPDKTYSTRFVNELVVYPNGKMLIDELEPIDEEELLFVGDIYSSLSPTPFPGFDVAHFIVLENKDIWVASHSGGVYVIKDNLQTLEKIETDPQGKGKLISDEVRFFYETKSGDILCYTTKGINIWVTKERKFQYLGKESGLDIHEIIGFFEDDEELLWFMCPEFIYSFDRNTEQLRSYLLPKEYHAKLTKQSGYLTTIKSFGDKILYAGENGIVELDLKVLQDQENPNDALISNLYINRNMVFPGDEEAVLDSALLYQKEFSLKYDQRNVGFSFVSTNGKDLDVNYKYRLRGYEDTWKDLGKERIIHFTNLDDGKYFFDVLVESSAGVESKDFSSVQFKVHPPWYRTWLAYLIYSLLFLAVLFYFIRQRIAQAIRKIKELESIRTKISSDLHDDVGTILSGIAMQAEMLSLNANNPDREELIELSADTRDAMEKMRDIVWALDSRKDKYENLIDKMISFAENKVASSKFKFNYDFNEIPGGQMINPDVRQNIYLIFKEAITNILKHSNGDEVTIKLKREGKNIRFSVRDNGDNTTIEKSEGLGLSNMKMRAERIGDEFFMTTTNGFEVGLLLSPAKN